MSKPNKPTQEQIHRTLEAKQVVYLASGYSNTCDSIWVKNWTALPNDEFGMWQLGFPEFGNWKSFDEIQEALRKKIDKKFPAKAFPFIRLGKITLFSRNEDDKEYLHDMGDFDMEVEENG